MLDLNQEKKVRTWRLWSVVGLGVFLFFALCFRFFCGVFVIQPIGAIPEGVTIVYWRSDLERAIPFIASADGLLEESGAGVSLFGRGVMLGALSTPILDREIFRFGYSETLYLWSTNGKEYNN